jgi:hypothetical protein
MLAGVSALACEAATTVDLLPDSGVAPLGQGAGGPVPACPAPLGAGGAGSTVVSGLSNRYDFSGTGTALCDLAEDRHGSIRGGAALDGSGALALDGVDDYVALPGGMVSRFPSVTLVTWFTWQDNRSWTRVFDFGQTEAQDGLPGTASYMFFFTPIPSNEPGTTTGFSLDHDIKIVRVVGTNPFPADVEQQIAVVVDGAASPPTLASYVGAVLEGQVPLVDPVDKSTPLTLSKLYDGNCWLGQSQQSWDAHMTGVYNEFRIYDRALTQAEIQALLEAGPDQP